jgi:hypothetical protein
MAGLIQDIIIQSGIPVWMIAILVVASIWEAVWKGFALWKAAKKNQLIWFVVILIFNTAGILSILYIFLFSEIKLDSKKERSKRRK